MAVCVRVSKEHGRSLESVARDSFALTLKTWGHLVAHEGRHRLLRQSEWVTRLPDLARAFNKPERIKDSFTELQDALGMRPSAEEAMKQGADLFALVAETDAIARAAAERERMESEPGGME